MNFKKFLKPKYIFNVAVIGLCLGIVMYFFFSEDGLRDLLRSDTEIIWFWIVIALLSEVMFMMFESTIFYILIKDKYRHFRFIDAIKVTMMGAFWSAVTPSSTGGQPMQIYLLHTRGVEVGFSTSRLMQKFMIYQVVLNVINIVAVLINLQFILNSPNVQLVIFLLVLGFISQTAVTAMFLLFSFSPKLSRKLIMLFAKILSKIKIVKNLDDKIASIDKQLETFHTSNKDIYRTPRLLIPSILLTICQFVAMFMVTYFIYLALGFNEANPLQIMSCQAYVNLMSGMIPLPGASGAAELGFTAFFSVFFLRGTLKSAALIWRFINYYGVIFVTAPFAYFTKGKTADDIEENS